MAASLTIEHEQGTYFGPIRGKHQGYYAGDFSSRPPQPSGNASRLFGLAA